MLLTPPRKVLSVLLSRLAKHRLVLGVIALILLVSVVSAAGFYHCLLLRSQWERAVTLGSLLSNRSSKEFRKSVDPVREILPLPRRLDDFLRDYDSINPR